MVGSLSIQDDNSELLTTAVLTDVGERLLDEAYQSGRKLIITEMSLGDSNLSYVKPDPSFTSLVHEFGRQPINEGNTDKTWVNAIVYVDAVRWKGNSILEFGLHDADGNMIVYSSYPRTTIPTEGAEYVQVEIECYLDLYNASSVTINITPIMPLASETESGLIKIATTDKVDDGSDDSTCITPLKLKEKTATDEDVDSQSNANKLIALPQFWRIINPIKDRVNEALSVAHSKWTYVQASLTTYGATKLSSAVNSTSESLAATSKAVKLVADIANSKITKAQADLWYWKRGETVTNSTKLNNKTNSNTADPITIAERNSDGDLLARLFRSSGSNENEMSGGLAFRKSTSDNYIRFCNNIPAIRSWLRVFSEAEGDARYVAKGSSSLVSFTQGFNANGWWRKWSDGRMECWGKGKTFAQAFNTTTNLTVVMTQIHSADSTGTTIKTVSTTGFVTFKYYTAYYYAFGEYAQTKNIVSMKNPEFMDEGKTVILVDAHFNSDGVDSECKHIVCNHSDPERFNSLISGECGDIKEYDLDLALREEQKQNELNFFESEKAVALRIEEDYRLELADISDEQMREVKEYIRAINPTATTRSIPVRPEIMSHYS
ncbi:hypothetical protein ERW49_18640 [Aliivibrio finisterrensis]|uniref:Phage tail fibre protein N-terminal domain-containing protein n=1 Tax=Aliivibrio finisterrensis TaxID=511998 RepID=A0A4Q5KAS0_9GAMM|nr:tail fiber protein [Aliivibrio finisterrensis]RYU41905.1 hypothetical protein ERW49_18640 [Aliivibrio finisterrensis]